MLRPKYLIYANCAYASLYATDPKLKATKFKYYKMAAEALPNALENPTLDTLHCLLAMSAFSTCTKPFHNSSLQN